MVQQINGTTSKWFTKWLPSSSLVNASVSSTTLTVDLLSQS
jgi:hypothetical protein